MTNGAPSLSDTEFYAIRDLLQQRFGINLTEQKRSLVIGRLSGLLRREGFGSFDEYYQNLLNDHSGQALSSLVDRLSTNHTHFYRESDHYQYFSDVALPEFQKTLNLTEWPRIWIAGCSSGEEAYNVAICMLESRKSVAMNFDPTILATDISAAALEKAQNGIYSADNVTKLPAPLVKKYFRKHSTATMQVNDMLTRLITFRRLNLIRDQFPFKRKFHAIFCRNVMIYFDGPTRVKLVQQFADLLVDGGYLFIGHSETLGRETPGLRYIRPAIYRREELL